MATALFVHVASWEERKRRLEEVGIVSSAKSEESDDAPLPRKGEGRGGGKKQKAPSQGSLDLTREDDDDDDGNQEEEDD